MKKSIQSLLLNLEKTRQKYWNIPRETGQFLNSLIKTQKIKQVFEIGTSNGYSGIWMAEALQQTKGQLTTIESHKKHRFTEAQKNFKKAKLTPYITQILGHAPEDIPKKPKHFDLIFLDATKYEHIDYLKILLPRTKKGSIIITDNIDTHKKELTPYIKKIQSQKNFRSHHLPLGTGLLLSIRN
jgi:predicted O-methyltransferase YrrM